MHPQRKNLQMSITESEFTITLPVLDFTILKFQVFKGQLLIILLAKVHYQDMLFKVSSKAVLMLKAFVIADINACSTMYQDEQMTFV